MSKLATLFIGLSISVSTTVSAEDYSSILKNKRLILQGATCAGLEFKGKNTLLGYAEDFCSRGNDEPASEERVRWISKNVFFATQKGRNAEGCPPGNHIYQVDKIGNGKIVLREFWTGFPDAKDSVETYKIVNSSHP
jgi:hypothetical protein